MKYRDTCKLKNGSTCVLRSAAADDAREMLRLLTETAGESDFLLRYPDETGMTEDAERDYLSNVAASPNALMLVAEADGRLIASGALSPCGSRCKIRHRAGLSIAVSAAYWGQGLGSAIFAALLACAKDAGYTLLELGVMADNVRAVALYEKFGFRVYGTYEKAFRMRDGSYKTELLMSREI